MNRRTRMAQLVEDLTEAGEALEGQNAILNTRNSNLEQAHIMDRQLLSSMSDKLQYQQRLLDDAIAIAGEMSVIFPATGEIKALAPRQHRESYEVHVTAAPTYFSPEDAIRPPGFTARVESLKLMIAAVRQDHLRGALHAHVKFADGEVAYGATHSALHSMPRDKLVRTIIQELGKALGDQLWKALR